MSIAAGEGSADVCTGPHLYDPLAVKLAVKLSCQLGRREQYSIHRSRSWSAEVSPAAEFGLSGYAGIALPTIGQRNTEACPAATRTDTV
jgi:hypothetical protein